MSFFDFAADLPHYADRPGTDVRLNARHRFLIEPFLAEIDGARVLDLGAHDGRWSYAFACAGAEHVTAIEGRAETGALFRHFPHRAEKERVDWRFGDVYAQLDTLIEDSVQFDIVALFGILYHLSDPIGLFERLIRLSPNLIIVDSEFIQRDDAAFRILPEDATNPLNGLSAGTRQMMLKAVPTKGALELLARETGYNCVWSNWDALHATRCAFVRYYFRKTRMRRETAVLRRQS